MIGCYHSIISTAVPRSSNMYNEKLDALMELLVVNVFSCKCFFHVYSVTSEMTDSFTRQG